MSAECASAMARGVLRHSGLLDPSDDREFKFGVLLERGQGIGISTTGYLDSVPDDEDKRRVGEVWIGCSWRFKGKEGERVERMFVGDVKGKIEEDQDEHDANREERKKRVVRRAVDVVLEVVTELESAEKQNH